ncbi:MAG: hypothetical protein ACXW4Z_23420, partial [Candidatus Binatia bacterium]
GLDQLECFLRNEIAAAVCRAAKQHHHPEETENACQNLLVILGILCSRLAYTFRGEQPNDAEPCSHGILRIRADLYGNDGRASGNGIGGAPHPAETGKS